MHTLHIYVLFRNQKVMLYRSNPAICFKICHVLYEKWKPQSCKFEACISKGYFIKHKTLISEKWKPGNPINVWNRYTQNILLVNTIILHTDWLWVQWLLSICNMHFHVEFHSPHTDKVQQNWILNMKGVREILSPSLDAIAAAFQTNYSALILQIPVWWPVQCMYTLQGHRYGNHAEYGYNISGSKIN